jgi:hypothetical protein
MTHDLSRQPRASLNHRGFVNREDREQLSPVLLLRLTVVCSTSLKVAQIRKAL